jgi:uncharacterized membrane protein
MSTSSTTKKWLFRERRPGSRLYVSPCFPHPTFTFISLQGTNLKLAIDYGLHKSQTDLIASFLQTLIMSEGDRWVDAQVATVAGSLREGNVGKPVQNAESTVRKFATKQLGKAETIAALED